MGGTTLGSASKKAQAKRSKSHTTKSDSPTSKALGNVRLNNSDDSDDSDGLDDDDVDENVEEPDEVAPSGPGHRARGHQTGLSITLSNTKINAGVVTRKRAWSNREREQEEEEVMQRDKARRLANESAATSEDDDDYAGVDLISESGSEASMEEDEEKMIIQDEEHTHDNGRPRSSSFESWDGFAGAAVVDNHFFSEHFEKADPYSSNAMYSPNTGDENDTTPVTTPAPVRRVRFADEVEGVSSNTSTTSDADIDHDTFPDLLAEQGKHFESSFYRYVDQESSSDGEGSYWDFGYGEETSLELERVHVLEHEESEVDEEGSSSGYETDEGETTDEEVLPPTTVNRPQALLRLDADTPRRPASSAGSTPMRRPPASSGSSAQRHGPSIGSWIADPTKPIAMIDRTGKNMIVYPAKQPKRHAAPAVLAPSSSNVVRPFTSHSSSFYDSESDRYENPASSMLSQSPANLMMSGLLESHAAADKTYKNAVTGPPEAFYPFRSINADGSFDMDDIEFDEFDDEDEMEANLDLNDFIDFGETSDTDEDSSGPSSAAGKGKAHSSAPRHPTAFRRNQQRVQALGRSANPTAVRTAAIKGGHLMQANEPISPVRKQKAHQRYRAPAGSLGALPAKRSFELV